LADRLLPGGRSLVIARPKRDIVEFSESREQLESAQARDCETHRTSGSLCPGLHAAHRRFGRGEIRLG
jgi:hypothetical protein